MVSCAAANVVKSAAPRDVRTTGNSRIGRIAEPNDALKSVRWNVDKNAVLSADKTIANSKTDKTDAPSAESRTAEAIAALLRAAWAGEAPIG